MITSLLVFYHIWSEGKQTWYTQKTFSSSSSSTATQKTSLRRLEKLNNNNVHLYLRLLSLVFCTGMYWVGWRWILVWISATETEKPFTLKSNQIEEQILLPPPSPMKKANKKRIIYLIIKCKTDLKHNIDVLPFGILHIHLVIWTH